MVYNVKVQGNPPNPPMAITVSYDICYDDFSNEWEAVGYMFTVAAVDTRDIQVTYKGVAPHGWPVMEMKFPNELDARRVTAAYMGIFNIHDEEVTDYIFGTWAAA